MSKKGVAIQMKPFDPEFGLRHVFFYEARQRVVVPEMASSSLFAKLMLAALFLGTKATIMAQSTLPSHDQLGIRRKVHGKLPPGAETGFREEIAPIFNQAFEGIKTIDLTGRKSLCR